MEDYNFQTKSVREGHDATDEQEHSAAIFLTSSYKFKSAEQSRVKELEAKEEIAEEKRYARYLKKKIIFLKEKIIKQFVK